MSDGLEDFDRPWRRPQVRPTMDELRAKYGPNWGIGASFERVDEAMKARARESMEKANRRFFEAECAAAGVDPAMGLSPSLLRNLREKGLIPHKDGAA